MCLPRAIADALAAFQVLGDLRMVFESLEFLVRVDVRVLVVQTHDHPDEHIVRLHMVEERPAEDVAGERLLQWEAEGVLDESGLEVLLWHLPDLFDAQAIGLLVLAFAQLKIADCCL